MIKIDLRNKWLNRFNVISLYMYMTHGLVISVLNKYVRISQKSDLLFSILTIFGTIFVSYMLKIIIDDKCLFRKVK